MELLVAFSLLLFLLYLLDRYLLSFWTRHGFPQENTTFFFGNILPVLSTRESIHEHFEKRYRENKHRKFVGYYNFYRPALLIIDPELIQNIMISDFNNFHDHHAPMDYENDPMLGNLFSLTGEKWRELRVMLSPTFTSGKLKKMFPLIKDCAALCSQWITKNVKDNKFEFDIRDMASRYSINIISTVAYGVDNDCINEPNHSFFYYGKKFFEPNLRNNLRMFLFVFLPSLMKTLKIKFAPRDVEEFFTNLFREIVEYREKNKIVRHDFLDLLIKLKNEGYIPPDKDENENAHEEIKIKKLTMEEIAAQSFTFFLASFETGSAPLAFCIYELAKNPKIQQKVHDELDKTLNATVMTYDSIKSLKYLECCILETLRKYAVVPLLSRRCTADYKIPNTDLIIPKGTELQIPVLSMQRDEDYYENPLEFRPERFIDSPNGQSKGKGITFMTFGDGPRHCIGMRMAKQNLAVGLSSLLMKYKFELVDERLYKNEIEFDRKQFPLNPNGRLMVRAIVR